MNKKNLMFLAFAVALAALLTLSGVPIVSSQGLTLVATKISAPVPADSIDSPFWNIATAIDVPMSAQVVAAPILPKVNVKSVKVRAVHNDQQFAVMVEWADPTKNDETVRVQDFRDAVAVEFPLAAGQPYVCMGQLGGNVNIWQWKADWEKDLAGWQDMETLYPRMNVDQYPFAKNNAPVPGDYVDPNYVPAFAANNLMALPHKSSVENLVAGGYGTLTTQAAALQTVHGYGEWREGKWRAIFTRDLASNDKDNVDFQLNKSYFMAFAAWDGANGERNGQKATSEWVTFQFGGTNLPTTPGPVSIPIVVPLTIAMGLVIVAFATVLIGGVAQMGRKKDSGQTENRPE
jgi:hypothetical protein